jgi:hypothetical protein
VSVDRAALVTLIYQRKQADDDYADVHQGSGASRETVRRTVAIDARP